MILFGSLPLIWQNFGKLKDDKNPEIREVTPCKNINLKN